MRAASVCLVTKKLTRGGRPSTPHEAGAEEEAMTEQTESGCPRISGCPMFPMFKSKSFLESLIAMYCEADFSRCARFQKSSAGEKVPPTLLPNGRDLSDPPSSRTGA